jgi:N4-gp56 family major capsid protein
MTRYNQLPSSLVPLGNTGVTPPSTQLTAVNIDAQINYYGQYIEINEQVTLQRKDPVLNAASERLGDAMRRTEDELTRNMLAGTAAFLNCVGGVNGRIVAVVKSFLIDLELLPGNAGDNRAQASLGWVA